MHAPLRGIWAGYGVDLGMDILAAQGASFQPGGQLGGGQVPRRPLFFFFMPVFLNARVMTSVSAAAYLYLLHGLG